MRATELLANQLQMVHARVAGLAGITSREWMARPAPTENRIGFTVWHIAATRDWTVRAILQGKPPIGWGGQFAGSGIGLCQVPFGMPSSEADTIAGAVSPQEAIAYSAAVTEELVRWLSAADDSSLGRPPVDGRAHLALSPRYAERAYRWELEEDPDDMTAWPVWMLLTRPCFSHALRHLTEIDMAPSAAAQSPG